MELQLTCPRCQDPNPKYYFNPDKGVGYCFHCQYSGGPQPNDVGPGSTFTPQPTLAPTLADIVDLSESYAARMVANLHSPIGRDALSYLMVDRGFKPQTIQAYEWGYDPDKVAIVLPRRNKEGRLVGIKYRHLHPEAPSRYTSIAGSKATLYNLQCLQDDRPSMDEVVLTEGEFDCASVYQYASRVPVLAVPGMNTFKDSWFKLFENFKKIYIAFDAEESADERAEALATKLKAYRCYRVRLPDGFKDINELVVRTGDKTPMVWNELLAQARCLGVPLTKDTNEYTEEALESYLGSDQKTISTGYPKLDECFGGFAPGRVYLVKGNTKLGKTTFALDLLVNAAQQGHKVILGSFEMKPAQEMLVKIISKMMGRDLTQPPKLDARSFRRAIELIHSWGTLTWINRHDYVRLGELRDAVKSKYEEGYRVLLLDHVQFLMNLGSDKEGAVFSQTARVSKFIKKFTNDFPELVVVAITELNNAEGTMGGKSLEYDSDVVLNYYGTGLTCERHRLHAKYRNKNVRINWHPLTHSYSVL